MVFIDNADKGEYTTSMSITNGKLKVGDKIDAVNAAGSKFSFTVSEIKVNDAKVNETSKTDNAFVVLKTTENATGFDAGFSISKSGEKTVVSTAVLSTSKAEASCL
ncbi:MAG: hypothetical protein HC854_02525 [Flavobacterium sp.]|nr:hypothetical protein [Flavobacterium sp.]